MIEKDEDVNVLFYWLETRFATRCSTKFATRYASNNSGAIIFLTKESIVCLCLNIYHMTRLYPRFSAGYEKRFRAERTRIYHEEWGRDEFEIFHRLGRHRFGVSLSRQDVDTDIRPTDLMNCSTNLIRTISWRYWFVFVFRKGTSYRRIVVSVASSGILK